MTSLGQPIPADELGDAMRVVFGSTDSVDFATFVKGYLKLQGNTDALKSAFELIDRDASGDISLAELNQLLNKSNLISEEGKAIIFRGADKDGSGGLDFEEFKTLQTTG
jgi:Ca2+-binding EF-hand superfamily protein